MKRRSTFGWLGLLRGIICLALGISILRDPRVALSTMVVVFAMAAIVSGIADIVLYAKLRNDSGDALKVSLFTGSISVLAGILLLLHPLIGKWLLNLVIPVWFVAQCISHIVNFDLIKQENGKLMSILLLCLNIAGLLLGIVMIFNSTLFTFSMGALVALVLIVLGASSAIEAFSNIGTSERK